MTTSPDLSGNGHDATFGTSNLTFDVAGPWGGTGGFAVDINPPNTTTPQVIASAVNSSGPFDLTTFTYECVLNVRDTGVGSFETLMGMHQGGSALRDELMIHRVPPNSGLGYVYAGNNVNFPDGNITDGAWHHVALTWDGTTWTLYKDGASGGTSTTGAPDLTVTHQQFNIGGSSVSASNIFNGVMAAAAVFSGALTGTQIAAHNTAIATNSTAYKTAVLADSPLALWIFGGGGSIGWSVDQVHMGR